MENFDLESLIIYSDKDLIIINKPAGLLSIRDGYDPDLPHISTILQPIFGKTWIIHRLDKGTSGIMLVGRNPDIHRYFNNLFQQHKVKKTYHALIMGNPDWQEITLDVPLAVNFDRLHRTRVDKQKGKPSITGLKVLKRFSNYSLIECNLQTGYTHQIRAVFFNLDLPVLGDQLYCKKNQRVELHALFPFDRLALHASSIEFTEPRNNKSVTYHAPYPEEISNMLI